MNNSEIINLIKELIEKTTINVNEISLSEEEMFKDRAETIWIKAEVSEPHLFLDRGGEALSALNHLVRKIAEARMPDRPEGSDESASINIMVDINGFQKKKIENIRAVAHMMAERARYFKSNIEVDPMPAFDRRIVHEFLSDATDLKTESQGEGLSRRVVIKYIGTI